MALNRKAKKEIEIFGEMFTVYSIGWLAILTNKGVANIRRWERKGMLPKPIVQIEGEDRRYYLAAELIGYSEIYKRSGIRAGSPIEESPFKLDCRRFKINLERALQNNKERKLLKKKLPQEQAFEEGISQAREEALRREAHALLSKPNEDTEPKKKSRTKAKCGRKVAYENDDDPKVAEFLRLRRNHPSSRH